MVKLLFDSWRGHTVDSSIVDVDDDAYQVLVLENEEEEKSSEMPSANDDGAGPSETAVDEEKQDILPQYQSLFENLGAEVPSEERQDGTLVVAEASDLCDGGGIPDID